MKPDEVEALEPIAYGGLHYSAEAKYTYYAGLAGLLD